MFYYVGMVVYLVYYSLDLNLVKGYFMGLFLE